MLQSFALPGTHIVKPGNIEQPVAVIESTAATAAAATATIRFAMLPPLGRRRWRPWLQHEQLLCPLPSAGFRRLGAGMADQQTGS